MWTDLCRDEYEASLFQAATLVTFWGAFRISEVIAGGKSDRSHVALQLSDVQLMVGKVSLHICKSKVDQRRK